MAISVIIPTFNNVEYLEECINSIYDSCVDREYEILIGIDGCKKTVEFIKNFKINENTKVFYFPNNGGPYIIKNTLSQISKYDKIIFFDSDDIMEPIMATICDEGLEKFHIVRPKYTNFKVINDEKVFEKNPRRWGEGVFAIKKEIFLGLNGFEGWRVAADSDFIGRLYRNRAKFWNTSQVLFKRRVHSESLTMASETGFNSEIRSQYARLSREKNTFGPLPNLAVGYYDELVFDKSKVMNLKDLMKENIDLDEKVYKERKKIISNILNNENIKPKLTHNNQIDYNQINKTQLKTQNLKINNAINMAKDLNQLKKKFAGGKIIK
jgi:glycosyltransferase involved in cell wall biosynthesis